MSAKPSHCCSEMAQELAADEGTIVFVPKFREYGIPINDGGTSYKLIHYCPWCGQKLPDSLRDEWFDKLEDMSIDPADEDAIPDPYRDSKWYTSR